jgi:anti-anti-sigma regulatory factor
MYSQLLITFSSARGILHVADDLDQAGEDQLMRRIDDALTAGCTRLEVDCSRVRHIGRPSLVALSAAKEHLTARGGWLSITAPSPAFVRTAQRSGFPELVYGDDLARRRALERQALEQ